MIKDDQDPQHEQTSTMDDSGERSDTPGDEDRLARRAYALYEQRGREHGRDLDDWLEAERETRESGGSDER